MMKKLAWFLLASGFLWSSVHALADSPAALATKAKAILQIHCAGCHGGGKAAKGGFGFVLDRELLIGRSLVVPGKTGQSDLFLRVQQGEMPPPAKKIRPSQAELRLLKSWIDAGAPPFDGQTIIAKRISEREVAGVILADLKKLDPRRRRFTRYLTLTHLAYAGRPEKDLQTTREAAAKLLNSLSWHPRIRLPEPVVPDGTILRIDLRAHKWTPAQWERLAFVYPYRTDTGNSKTLNGYAGTEAPALRADWFVATASRPPFYHDLLQLPASDRGLERLLQVDVPANIQDDDIQRSGFNDSGVSKNNRLIERHDAIHGVFWRSYDFSSNTGRQNLFEHPLGPNTGAISFQSAGGEMIFNLPNGLLAYMLVDAKGRRIDKGPIEIVADPRRPDQRVETGISCMSCHARGFLFKADQLRGHVEKNAEVFGKQVLAAIRATHPHKAKFQAQIDEDNQRYLKALAKFGIHDPDQEPINLVTQRFEATLDGPTAAAELGLTLKEFGMLLKKHPDQARIFGGLLAKGGTAQRQVFQENFAELARLVKASQAAFTQIPDAEPFKGHSGTVNGVAFSADGKRAASAGDDRTIRIWTIPSGKELIFLKGASEEINAIAFSPDGRFLLSAGTDRLLRLWDLQTGNESRRFKGHTDVIRTVAFSPDGKKAISGGADRSLRVWDIASGQEIAALAGHSDAVTSAVWSPHGVLSGSRDGTVRLWNVAKQKQILRLEGHAAAVLSVALSPDGATAVSGGNDKTVRYWNLATGKELHCFKGHENAVIQVQFSADGRVVNSSSGQHLNPERAWRRWDLVKRIERGARDLGEERRFGCAAFSPDCRRILVGGPGGFVFLRDW
jgi:WD40 repeat protein